MRVYGGFDGTEQLRAQRDIGAHATVLSGEIGNRSTNADNSYHVVTAARGALLDGVTLSGGFADGDGLRSFGGALIATYYSAMALRNVTFERNVAAHGGALFAWIWSSPHLLGCAFVANSAIGGPTSGGGGGAMLLSDGANATVRECTFASNLATRRGGAIFADYGTAPSIERCAFDGNSAGALGGALFADDRAARVASGTGFAVADSTFVANRAALLGGAACDYNEAQSTFSRCEFDANGAGEVQSYVVLSQVKWHIVYVARWATLHALPIQKSVISSAFTN